MIKNSSGLKDKDKDAFGYMLLALRDLKMEQQAAENMYNAVQISISKYQRAYAGEFFEDFTKGERVEWEKI